MGSNRCELELHLQQVELSSPTPLSPSTTMTPQLFGEIEYGILEMDAESVYWVSNTQSL